MKLIEVSFEQCRLDFFKEQFASAKRKLDWAVKHNPNCYDVAEKADAYNFYEWAVTMAEMAGKDTNVLTNADRIRAMSDEELCSVVRLAAFADVCYMSCECHECVFHGLCEADEYEVCSDEQEEITTVMKWLKQPAE